MDKALVFGTKDCRFESCQGHLCKALVCPLLLGQVKALGAAATIGISHKKSVEHGQAVSMQFCPLGRNKDQMTSTIRGEVGGAGWKVGGQLPKRIALIMIMWLK